MKKVLRSGTVTRTLRLDVCSSLDAFEDDDDHHHDDDDDDDDHDHDDDLPWVLLLCVFFLGCF